MRLWFARDIWRYRNVFWLIDWLMINNHFCSMSCIPHVKNSHKFYLPSFPFLGWPYKTAGHRDSKGIWTGLVARSVSAVRFGSGTSLPGLRAPSFRFFVVSYVFRLRVRILVFVFYEPRLALLLNVRALSVTVCSRTVVAEHLREERKPSLLMSI